MLARLAGYWRMEAANVVLVPGAALVVVLSLGGTVSAGLGASTSASAFLLCVGAAYWRTQAIGAGRGRAWRRRWIARLAAAEPVALVLLVVSLVVLLTEPRPPGWVTGAAAWTLWVLGVLEYVNYYVVQLQHFDNARDLHRLFTGRGFRRAHLAKDIRRLRKRTGALPAEPGDRR